MEHSHLCRSATSLTIGLLAATTALPPTSAVAQQAISRNSATVISLPAPNSSAPTITSRPKSPLPMLKRLPAFPSSATTPPRSEGIPGARAVNDSLTFGVISRNYGAKFFAYTTALVKPMTAPKNTSLINVATSSRPYLTSGKLWMKFDDGWYICSGAMIGKGIVNTAAHCVARFGEGTTLGTGVASEVWFVPAATTNTRTSLSTAGPVGAWSVALMYIPPCYTTTTVSAQCRNTNSGVVTSNDLAILRLNKNSSNKLPFDVGVSHYAYGWNGYGYTEGNEFIASSKVLGQITTLGYPGALGDSSSNLGGSMVRTDSASVYYLPATGVKNHVWGTQQTGGSSGSPVITNFGTVPIFDASVAHPGRRPVRNVIVGAISWGYTDRTQQVGGSSWYGQNTEYPDREYRDGSTNYGAGNIGSLMREVCGRTPTYGGGQALGFCF